MHCVNCGTQNLDTTRYCKSCGANLEVLRQALTQNLSSGATSMIGPKHVGLILVLSGLTAIGGFGALFGCLVALAAVIGPSLGDKVLPLLFLLGAMGIAGVTYVVASMLRMLKTAGAEKTKKPPVSVAHAVLEPGTGHVLPPFREPVSVVEHTTARLGDYAAPPPRNTGERQ